MQQQDGEGNHGSWLDSIPRDPNRKKMWTAKVDQAGQVNSKRDKDHFDASQPKICSDDTKKLKSTTVSTFFLYLTVRPERKYLQKRALRDSFSQETTLLHKRS
jgi:hypothetical protein